MIRGKHPASGSDKFRSWSREVASGGKNCSKLARGELFEQTLRERVLQRRAVNHRVGLFVRVPGRFDCEMDGMGQDSS